MMPLCNSIPKNNSRNLPGGKSARPYRATRLRQRVDVLKSNLKQSQQQILELKKRLSDTVEELENAKAELTWRASTQQSNSAPIILQERPMPGFQFSLTVIATAIELGKRVGFRAAADAMRIVFDMLNIDVKIPSHDAVEQWTLRLGVASLNDTFTKSQRVLWMVDHSSQVGKERLLLIVGIALEDLPRPGESLTFDKLKVLAMVPGQSWKKEDVEREYLKLAGQIGTPVYVVCDGAVELREPAGKLENNAQKTIVLGDLKHRAANVLEKEISRGGRFQAFLTEVGLTRSRVQQTELDQFAPPSLRSKSRFMNLGPLFLWARMVLYHLNNPASESHREISVERMEQKLGWLREYVDDLSGWHQCQEVIDRCLSVVNLQGLDAQTEQLVERSLAEHNANWHNEDCSATRVAGQLIDWIKQSFSLLKPDERAWLSTEILESLFGKFKQIERQHSKGGFTRLIAAIPTLCMKATPETVRNAFKRVNSEATQLWLKASLGTTLTARRNAAYRESKRSHCDPAISTA